MLLANTHIWLGLLDLLANEYSELSLGFDPNQEWAVHQTSWSLRQRV